jgi:hypothetical protein
VALGERAIERGLAAGLLVVDTRLRDALRALGDGEGGFRRPARGVEGTHLHEPTLRENAAYAGEILSLAEADLVRLGRRVDELTARVKYLEGRASWR